MATQTYYRWFPTVLPKVVPRPVAPGPKLPPLYSDITHTALQVCKDTLESPLPDNIDVQVFDPSRNIKTPFRLKSTDTTDMLISKYQEIRNEPGKNLHLVFNGKPVQERQILRDLGVKSGAVFITFQKCTGG